MYAFLLLISGSERTNIGVFLRRQSTYGNGDSVSSRNLRILHSVAFLSGIIKSILYKFHLTIIGILQQSQTLLRTKISKTAQHLFP